MAIPPSSYGFQNQYSFSGNNAPSPNDPTQSKQRHHGLHRHSHERREQEQGPGQIPGQANSYSLQSPGFSAMG